MKLKILLGLLTIALTLSCSSKRVVNKDQSIRKTDTSKVVVSESIVLNNKTTGSIETKADSSSNDVDLVAMGNVSVAPDGTIRADRVDVKQKNKAASSAIKIAIEGSSDIVASKDSAHDKISSMHAEVSEKKTTKRTTDYKMYIAILLAIVIIWWLLKK